MPRLDRDRGVRGVLLNIGGDVRVVGEWRGRSASRLPSAIRRRPSRSLLSRFATVRSPPAAARSAGSGCRRKVVFAHLRSCGRASLPGTGSRCDGHRQGAADANALATTLNVLPIEDGLRLAASLPDVECLVVADRRKVRTSAGWTRYERPLATAPEVPATPASLLKNRMALRQAHGVTRTRCRVNFEIGGPAGNARGATNGPTSPCGSKIRTVSACVLWPCGS